MSVTQAEVLSVPAHLERVAIEVATMAARYVESQRGQARAVDTKSSPTDVVTATDLESERRIRSELLARCPGSTIVGEEYDDATGTNVVRWIVDPIDGTVNFLYGLPVVSISIAACLDDQTVAGAVVDVRSGEVYSARRSEGAFHEGRPIHVAQPDGFSQSLIGTGFSYSSEIRRDQAETIRELLPACRDIRCMGSAALNLCWVGAGLLDGYFERGIKIYDYAAGALIAAEAGAQVGLPDEGSDLAWAAAPSIADELAALIGVTAPG